MISLAKVIITFCLFSQAQLMSEYTQKTGKLSNLEKKISTFKEDIKTRQKLHDITKDEQKKREIYTEIISLHDQYREAVENYNAIRHDLRFRFPEKNDQTNRRYLPLRAQSIDEIQNEKGISSTLTRMKRKIDKKYAPYIEEPEDPRAFVKKTEKVKKKRIRLER